MTQTGELKTKSCYVYTLKNYNTYNRGLCAKRGNGMIISERIFEMLKKRKMSQKDFSKKTGIAQSTISDWKRRKTNPSADKILIICETLQMTPYELLSGVDTPGIKSNRTDILIVDKRTEEGILLEQFLNMDQEKRQRVMGYVEAVMGDMHLEGRMPRRS